MTAEELKATLENIVREVNQGADVASIFVPQVAAWIAIGKALDVQIPGLVMTVQGLVAGKPPTDEELATKARQLAVLSNPNLP